MKKTDIAALIREKLSRSVVDKISISKKQSPKEKIYSMVSKGLLRKV